MCNCPMRDGGHEWTCGEVGEYGYIHCRRCDKSVWSASMACALCPDCSSYPTACLDCDLPRYRLPNGAYMQLVEVWNGPLC